MYYTMGMDKFMEKRNDYISLNICNMKSIGHELEMYFMWLCRETTQKSVTRDGLIYNQQLQTEKKNKSITLDTKKTGSKKSLTDHIRKDHLQLTQAHTNYNGWEDKPCGMADARVDNFMRRRQTNACTQTKRYKKESAPADRQRHINDATLHERPLPCFRCPYILRVETVA
jgi:hypothetical protein